MNYDDGREIKPGDIMLLDGQYRGRVLANMDTRQYLPGEEHWVYLQRGIMVDTDFAGLMYYDAKTESFELIDRPPQD